MRYSAPPKFSADFVARTYRLPNLLGWLLLLVGGMLGSIAVSNYFVLQESRARSEASLVHVQRSQNRNQTSLKAEQAHKAVPEAERAKLVKIAQALNTPWQDLFVALETALNGDVALLSFEPRLEKGSLVLKGQARSLKAVFDFSSRLAQQKGVTTARVQNYEFKQSEGVEVVEFVLEANWGLM